MDLTTVKTFISDDSAKSFDKFALTLFTFHYYNNLIYYKFCKNLSINPLQVKTLRKIPFMPVSFFKSQKVIVEGIKEKIIFESSGTTGKNVSKHYIGYPSLYKHSFSNCFRFFYGNISQYAILALLPDNNERQNSSLIYMVNHLITLSKNNNSGFYLNNYEKLYNILLKLNATGKKTILIGLSFYLLDFAEKFKLHFPELIVVETGGMKGRGKEIIRRELHERLKNAFGVRDVHSEYGMTELLSQAWSQNDGYFRCPPWMKILIRDPYDPLSVLQHNRNGAINIIDFANAFSCPFIATDDIGKTFQNGCFEISGRLDNTDVRGCNVMI